MRGPCHTDRITADQQYEQRLYIAADESCRPRGGPSVILGILKVSAAKKNKNEKYFSR